ncbi:hypothetical protein [Streptomyces omiyaensis]|uniref:DNA-binding protein n=1 Tax=Streptomyces omiyaensis TaxID=68247 RepID=A0ABW7BU49_9ACTN|nr:hypothetical protein [Streptomyces omiyaensis]GGY50611.1 hypothetical protein GCM10010363_34420 [Streptomyces omiyaensis]
MWEPDGADGHVGRVGVLLEDGTTPGPVYIDLDGSGHVPGFTGWWVYDGTLRRPLANRMRAVCACGWASGTTYPIAWELVPDSEPFLYDTSGPERDWAAHTRQVSAAAVPLPEEVARLVSRIRERLDEAEDTDPLTALRIIGALDAVIETDAPYVTRAATRRHTDGEIAAALGSTEKALAARLRRYDSDRF